MSLKATIASKTGKYSIKDGGIKGKRLKDEAKQRTGINSARHRKAR
jgi:hypothetical protein